MNIAGHSDGFWVLADSAASKSNPGRTEGAIRRLYNAFWDIDSFCIYQQGLTDIMHTWSLGILDYVIFSVVNEMINSLRSFELRKTSRRQGEEFHPPLFTDAFIRRLFTDEVPKLVRNIDQNTAGLILPESTASAGENSKLFVAEKHNLSSGKNEHGPGNLQAATTDCLGQCIPVLIENIFDYTIPWHLTWSLSSSGQGDGGSSRGRSESVNEMIHRNRANLLERTRRDDPTPRMIAAMCSLLKVPLYLN